MIISNFGNFGMKLDVTVLSITVRISLKVDGSTLGYVSECDPLVINAACMCFLVIQLRHKDASWVLTPAAAAVLSPYIAGFFGRRLRPTAIVYSIKAFNYQQLHYSYDSSPMLRRLSNSATTIVIIRPSDTLKSRARRDVRWCVRVDWCWFRETNNQSEPRSVSANRSA